MRISVNEKKKESVVLVVITLNINQKRGKNESITIFMHRTFFIIVNRANIYV